MEAMHHLIAIKERRIMIKIFCADSVDELEKLVNKFAETHEIINISYAVESDNNRGYIHHRCCVLYKQKS